MKDLKENEALMLEWQLINKNLGSNSGNDLEATFKLLDDALLLLEEGFHEEDKINSEL